MIAAALMLISASAYAQLSVGAGYLNTTLLEKQGSLSSGENFNGLYIEAEWKINIYSDFIGFTPGVRYNFGTTSVEGVSWNEQYVDIPLMFDFGYSFSDSFRFLTSTAQRPARLSTSTLAYANSNSETGSQQSSISRLTRARTLSSLHAQRLASVMLM